MVIAELRALSDSNSQESIRLQELRECAIGNEEYQQLKEIILQGFPNNHGQLLDQCKKILASTPSPYIG